MARILIIEDEEKMARMLARVLREEGYVVETAGDGRTGLGRALDDSFDLLIVDWMLPERSGIQIVRGLRAADIATPALMLTARDQVEDRVEGLDAGADDYLPKPFALPELLARVRALTRRPRGTGEDGGQGIQAGDIVLDPVRHVVRRGDERIDLTAKEFALLAALMQRPTRTSTAGSRPPTPRIPTSASPPKRRPAKPSRAEAWSSAPEAGSVPEAGGAGRRRPGPSRGRRATCGW